MESLHRGRPSVGKRRREGLSPALVMLTHSGLLKKGREKEIYFVVELERSKIKGRKAKNISVKIKARVDLSVAEQ